MSAFVSQLWVKPGGMRRHLLVCDNDVQTICNINFNEDELYYGLHATLDIVDPTTGSIQSRANLHSFLQIQDTKFQKLISNEKGLFSNGQRLKNPYCKPSLTITFLKEQLVLWVYSHKFVPCDQQIVLYHDKYEKKPEIEKLQLFAFYDWENTRNPIFIKTIS